MSSHQAIPGQQLACYWLIVAHASVIPFFIINSLQQSLASHVTFKESVNTLVIFWLLAHTFVSFGRHRETSWRAVIFISQAIVQNQPVDLVPTLVANAHPPAIEDYLKRPRGEWPTPEQLHEVQQMPLCVVLVGSKVSQNSDKEARHSWSPSEMLLISRLPIYIKKGLIAAKFTYKHCVKINRGGNVTDDGRSHVGSYHLKTTLLNHLEKTPPSKINSAFHIMMNVFHDLCMYIKRGNLPHYFLPECNLLATVGEDERKIALQTIQDIVCDPITTILKCPAEPTKIYGDICPDDLVATFHGISAHPCSVRRQEDLAHLLSRLDKWRDWCYDRLLETDRSYVVTNRVSGRPELTGLLDMLDAWKKENTWKISAIY